MRGNSSGSIACGPNSPTIARPWAPRFGQRSWLRPRSSGPCSVFRRAPRAELETTARTDDAIDTSAIEGEVLQPESARSSILRRLSPTGIHRSTTPDAESIAAVTIDATQHATRRISAERLIRWNRIRLRKAAAGFRAPGPDVVVQSGPEWTRIASLDDDGLIAAAKTHL